MMQPTLFPTLASKRPAECAHKRVERLHGESYRCLDCRMGLERPSANRKDIPR